MILLEISAKSHHPSLSAGVLPDQASDQLIDFVRARIPPK
jgi:hypothetical protein